MHGDDVWRGIEALIYRDLIRPEHRDDVRPVVGEIAQYLKADAIVALLRQMGLLSVGYLFDAPWARTFEFFRGEEDRSQHYRTPYLWMHQDALDRFNDFLHTLFLVVREQQRRRLEQLGYHTEEFYLCLPHLSSGARPDDRAYYCSIGKLLFWLYCWRLLWYFEHFAGFAAEFEPGRVLLSDALPDPAAFSWCGQTVEHAALGEAVQVLKLDCWAAEYRTLCFCNATGQPTPWVGTVRAHLQDTLHSTSLKGEDLLTLDSTFQSAVSDWLSAVVPPDQRQSCRSARLWMEQNAPAPLLPYYFWIGLDTWPKTFLACPVWASPFYPAKVLGGVAGKDTPIAGLALCGVAPQEEWEKWDEVVRSQLAGPAFGVCHTPRRDVIEFLTLLGQPAVEFNRFTPLAAELRRRERDHVRAEHAYVLRRGLIHEGGQLGRLVTGFADGYLTRDEVSGAVRAVNLASQALARLLNVDLKGDKKRCADIIAFVDQAIRLPDLAVSFKAAEELADVRVPTALEFVLIELCRNAYNVCSRDSEGVKRVSVVFQETNTPKQIDRVSVTHPGVLKRPEIDTDIQDVPPESLDRGRGLDIISYIVKKVMKGRFALKQQGAEVHAYVERF